MRISISVGVFITIISTALSQNVITEYPFDCNRMTASCLNDGICRTEGDCQCSAEFEGPNCGYRADAVPCETVPAVTSPCVNGGICHKDSDPTVGVCSCKNGFFGTNCEQEIASVDCQGQTVVYTLSLPSEFDGRVAVVTETGEQIEEIPPCTFEEATDLDTGRKKYSLSANIQSDNTQELPPCIYLIDGNIYQANVMVSYRQNFQTGLDQSFQLNCSHDTEGSAVSVKIGNVEIDRSVFDQVNVTKPFTPFVTLVVDEKGTAIEDTVTIGQKILMNFIITASDTGYSDVLVTNCRANNIPDQDGVAAVSFDFLTDSCPTSIGSAIKPVQLDVQEAEGESTGGGKQLSFDAFLFTSIGSSNQIEIVCNVRSCREPGDTKCDIPDCPPEGNEGTGGEGTGGEGTEGEGTGGEGTEGEDTGGGGTNEEQPPARRKRAAEDDEIENTVSKVFTIVGQNENRNDKTSEQQAEPVDPVEECLAKTEITALVAVLGAVVLVLLILCFFLACIIFRGKGKNTTTYDPTLFQPKPDRFQIPRAHVNESYEIM